MLVTYAICMMHHFKMFAFRNSFLLIALIALIFLLEFVQPFRFDWIESKIIITFENAVHCVALFPFRGCSKIIYFECGVIRWIPKENENNWLINIAKNPKSSMATMISPDFPLETFKIFEWTHKNLRSFYLNVSHSLERCEKEHEAQTEHQNIQEFFVHFGYLDCFKHFFRNGKYFKHFWNFRNYQKLNELIQIINKNNNNELRIKINEKKTNT